MKTKECPSCAMQIDANSRVCPICKYQFAEQPSRLKWTALVLAILFFISGGIASFIAGKIVVETADGKLENYDTLGYVVVGAMIITVIMMYSIHVYVDKKAKLEVKPQA